MPEKKLVRIYDALYTSFGPQYWWPGETQFEVAVGAILTQNTNWGNVEKAIKNLKAKRLLRPSALHNLLHENLAELLRPAGYFNIKAKRLKNFVWFLMENYQGSMKLMKKEPLQAIRNKLLEVNGIGPETADSIILYALEKPVFVIDAYTKRVLSRHNILGVDESYGFYQDLFHSNLKKNIRLFNEYHALIVKLAKENCRTRPLCSGCPLEGM
jgi:endonuclease III related protein